MNKLSEKKICSIFETLISITTLVQYELSSFMKQLIYLHVNVRHISPEKFPYILRVLKYQR